MGVGGASRETRTRRDAAIRRLGFISGLLMGLVAVAPVQAEDTIHVFVALADNDSQGIVSVPPKLGDGNDPDNNLYWGALYGVKTHFRRSPRWHQVPLAGPPGEGVLERVAFEHKASGTMLVADAYRGNRINQAMSDFLVSAAGHGFQRQIVREDEKTQTLSLGGGASLLVFVGHNGLMDLESPEAFVAQLPAADPAEAQSAPLREAIVLACLSERFFAPILKRAGARPLLMTASLMAPEAYSLEAALEGWIGQETPAQIRQRAAQSYAEYQRIRVKSALRVFTAEP